MKRPRKPQVEYEYTGQRPTQREVIGLVNKIKRHLQGKGPELQGAVLADLLAMFIAGHHPSLREAAMEIQIATARALVPINEAALIEWYGRPEGWDNPPPGKKGH